MYLEFKGDKLDVNLIDEGQGDVIVFLHGWGAKAEIYRSIINLITPHYRVIAPDFPGFGGTTEPSFAYSAEDYGDFVLALLSKLGITKASFIGHSHGGRTVIELATRENQDIEIDKIVLMDSAGIRAKLSFTKKLRVKTFKALKAIVMIKPINKAFPNALESLKKKFGSSDYSAASDIMRLSFVKVVNSDYKDRLCKISRPTLLLWGEKDTATPLSDAEFMKSKIPDSGLVTVKNGGHFCFTEDFGLVARVLASFFKF